MKKLTEQQKTNLIYDKISNLNHRFENDELYLDQVIKKFLTIILYDCNHNDVINHLNIVLERLAKNRDDSKNNYILRRVKQSFNNIIR